MPKCAASSYAMVAHSAGGMCVQDLWARYREELVYKLKALIFTDSSYHGMFRDITRKELRFLKRIGVHYRAFRGDF